MRKGNSRSQRKRYSASKASPLSRGTRAPLSTSMTSQTEQPEPPPLGTDQFQALMQAISGCQITLTTKIEQMQMEMGLITRDMDKYRDRLSEVERRTSDTEDMVRDQGASLHMLQVPVKAMEARAEDQENRNCRNNLRVVGLPEGVEGRDPAAYTEQLLRTLLPQAPLSPILRWKEHTECCRLKACQAHHHAPLYSAC